MRQDFIFAYIKRIFVFFTDLIGVLAGLVEEVCQIYLVSACLVFAKANGADQGFVIVVGIEECAMHAAKINKVERGASHNEHSLKIVSSLSGCEVVYHSALGAESELTHPR